MIWLYNHKVYQINISTGACEWKKDNIMYPRQVAFNGNIMYINHSGGLFVRNVSTNSDLTCSAILKVSLVSGLITI